MTVNKLYKLNKNSNIFTGAWTVGQAVRHSECISCFQLCLKMLKKCYILEAFLQNNIAFQIIIFLTIPFSISGLDFCFFLQILANILKTLFQIITSFGNFTFAILISSKKKLMFLSRPFIFAGLFRLKNNNNKTILE